MRRPNSRQNSPLAFQRSMAKASAENASEDVPYALRVSAAWAWRLGLVLVVSGILIWLIGKVSLIVMPLMVAGLLAGLLSPVTEVMRRHRVPGSLAVAEVGCPWFTMRALRYWWRSLTPSASARAPQSLAYHSCFP